eukprot:3057202-Pyramimonas_sp.AAC.1
MGAQVTVQSPYGGSAIAEDLLADPALATTVATVLEKLTGLPKGERRTVNNTPPLSANPPPPSVNPPLPSVNPPPPSVNPPALSANSPPLRAHSPPLHF